MSDTPSGRQTPDALATIPENSPLEKAVLWKVTLRLVPFLFLLYVFNILDRVNVGFAWLQMKDDHDLGISQSAYGLGVGIFFIGYFVFEVPSNLMLRRMGARIWIGRILISWGLISTAMMFITGPWSLYLLRFLLGIAEAGFFPGIILYLSYWFPARARARAVSRFMTGSAVTGIVGNPVSGEILKHMSGVADLKGWQWLFLLEGVPTVVLGVIALYYLTDRPERAEWLEPEERDWLASRMSREEGHREKHHQLTLLQALSNGRVLLLCALYFTVSVSANSYGAYVPQWLQDAFQGADEAEVGWLAAIPSLAAIFAMVAIGVHSDHTGERRWHIAVPALVAAAGFALTAMQLSPWLVLLGLVLAQAGMLSMLAPFWALPTSFLSGAAAAGGIAFINSIGNLGGFVGPKVLSWGKEATDNFQAGLVFLAVVLLIGAGLALCARHERHLEKPEHVS